MKKIAYLFILLVTGTQALEKEPYITFNRVLTETCTGSKKYQDFKIPDERYEYAYFMAALISGFAVSITGPLVYKGLKEIMPSTTKEFSKFIKSVVAYSAAINTLNKGISGSFKILAFLREQAIMKANPKFFTKATTDEHFNTWPSLLIDPAIALGTGLVAFALLDTEKATEQSDKEVVGT